MTQTKINRPEDIDRINTFYARLNSFDNHTLIDAYNTEKRVVGVHAQTLYLIAMNEAFLDRFGKSPVSINEESQISISGPIYYIDHLQTFDWFNKN